VRRRKSIEPKAIKEGIYTQKLIDNHFQYEK